MRRSVRGLGFANDPKMTPKLVIKPPTYFNTTVGFRLISRCRCPR